MCTCCVQFECLATTKLENNPMAGLYNVSENFWVGKVRDIYVAYIVA